MRRRLPRQLFALLLAALALALVACGDDSPGAEATAAAPGPAAESFPVTITHAFGETRITEPPQRVVTIGFNEHDFALALGVTPIAVREWLGGPSPVWPWAQDELGDSEPTVLSIEALDFEQLAALRPDLILGIYSGMTAEDYERLSQIAPTVARAADDIDFGIRWQDQLRTTGEALGRADEAAKLTQDLEARFAQVREEHPEFAGKTAIFAYLGTTGTFGVYSSRDPRGRFLSSLGFEPAEDIDELAGDGFFTTVSEEKLRLLDRDALVMIDIADIAADREELLENPLFRRLDVVREGRDIYPDAQTAAALSFSSPLSLPRAIDRLVPALSDAVTP